ncbi:MAG: carbohydrate ABC transporter permease [Anaerolineae bacterium]|jgi:ABC-type glycerol-3-phosphate transport system permease component
MADNVLQHPAKTYDVEAVHHPGVPWHRLVGRGLMYALLTIAAIVAMFPFFWMISTSLMTLGETQIRSWLPSVPQWGNYAQAWEQAQFSRYFMNSVIITATTIAGLLYVSITAAYAFARINFFGKNVLFTMLLITLMIPEAVTLIPNYLTVSGQIFPLPLITPAGEASFRLGNSWIDSLPALTVPFMGSAFSIFLLRQFFAQIPNELWEAARIDGAGHVRFLLQIVLPISTAPLMTVSLLTFIGAWNAFLWPLIVTNDDRWRPITVGLYRFSDEAGTQFHLLMAGALITILPILILYFFTQKTFTAGIATTGLKG